MKPQHSRANNYLQASDYRQSLSILSSELLRHSLASDSPPPAILRQSFGFSYRARNTINIELAQQILSGLERQKKDREKTQLTNLKCTLDELQKKISKAKKKLNTFTNVIGEQSDDEGQEEEQYQVKTLLKLQDATTVGSSVSKFAIPHHQIDFSHTPKIKTYYLSNLIPALQGKNKRALEHLNVSLKSPTFAELELRKVNLPRDKMDIGKKTLLIDIDETILHCEEESSKPYDLMLPIEIQNGSTAQAYITIRPYAITFLKRMAKLYEIVAFTASHESYADIVLDEIDPNRQFIRHRLYRRNCIQIHQNIYAKDLRIVNRDLSSMVLIDNAPYSYLFQLQNGIPILPYYSGEDNQLSQLQKYLQQMSKCGDVREFNKQKFKLHKYCHFTDLEDLVNELYISEQCKK